MTTAYMSGDATTVVQVNRHRLLELGLYSSTFTTVTVVAWWFWQAQIDPAQLTVALVANDLGARLTQFLLAREMVVALATAEFFLGLAALLALTPLGWWLESALIPEPKASPVMLLAQALRKASAAQKAALANSGPDPVSQPVTPEGSPIPGDSAAPGVPGHPSNPSAQHQGVAEPGQQPQPGQPPAPGQPQAAAQPGQPPAPGQPQAAAQPGQSPTPGQPQAAPQPGQPPAPGQPQAAQQPGQPAPPQSALQALEMTPAAEESPLDMLNDMSDLLSVFDDDTGIEQWLLDMSDGLDDVEVTTLAITSAQVLRGLRAPQSRPQAARLTPLAA